jgi:hypothetical protein
MAEIINTIPLNPITFEFQEYSVSDTSLITSVEVENSFNPSTDHIEYFIYDLNGNILTSNVSSYNGYRLLDNVLTIYPDIDLTTQGFTEGQYNTLYNFVSNKLASNPNNTYYISQISPDRTEVRLDTTFIPNILVISSSLELTNDIATSTGSYYDFYLNFGDNQLAIANNILLDTSSINNPTVLIKLYEALPQQFDINSQCWVVTQVASPVAYNINITQTFDITDEHIYLKGPNTNINIKNQINNSTDYSNLNQLSVTDSTQGSGSLRYQLNSLLAKTGININVDYSNYDNFIHFSSAQTRLENFYYKLSLIEQYNYSASYSSTTPANYYVSSSNVIWQSKINELITGFDNYEYFLYFDSGSACWPKTGNTPPYTNVSTTSITGQVFFDSQSLIAEQYDIENNNALINTIPSYLLEDPDNNQYELFIEMIGQHFDNIFLYTQDVTNKYNADNRVNYGVSKDLVADILRDLGIKIYQNNFSTNDLYSALLGLTPSGSLYNLPYTTGSLPTPAGYEYINTYITASSTSSLIPTEDLNAEIYKRIYANLPYLLKKKGTVEGLRALITVYGIPDTILQVHEFGGQDKIIANDYDLWFNQYNYAFTTEYAGTQNYISASFPLNPEWNSLNNVPQAVELRFKTHGLPQNTGSIVYQNIWNTSGSSDSVALILRYTGSGYDTNPPTSENPLGEPYSGSIANPYNQFGLLEFIPDITTPDTSASVYLPFFNGGWWSVLINNEGGNFTLYSANKNYEGEDGNYIGFQSSSSISTTDVPWNSSLISYFGISSSLLDASANRFLGSFQEIRYYTVPLSQSEFSDYVMNPYSIDSNGTNTAPDTLAFRATLGGELYTSSISVHPKITGSWVITQSFDNGVVEANSNFNFETNPIFVPNTEIIYLNQFPAGIKNRVSNKIRQQGEILPYSGSDETNLPTNQVLSPFISVQQSVSVSGSYTPNIDYVEIAFSPQNEINNDIAGQLGYFNIGEYIGDPRLVPTRDESYPALNDVRDYYFEKYKNNYNIWDYIRLIKYFDNSLFKMIQDWTPARTDLASGIVIKQTTLERNKYPVPQPNITSSLAWIESGSYKTDIVSYNSEDVTTSLLTNITQSYNINTYFTGSFNNASGDTLVECNIWYFPPTYPSVPLINLLSVDVPISNTTAFSFYYGGITDGGTITFAATSSGDGVFLNGGFTGSWFEDVDIQYETENLLITGSPIQIVTITGSTGGTTPDLIPNYSYRAVTASNGQTYKTEWGTPINPLLNLTQSWLGSTPSLSGSVPFTQSTAIEFFNGELSGSVITVTTGSLNGNNPYLTTSTQLFKYAGTSSTNYDTDINTWLTSSTFSPGSGQMNVYINYIEYAPPYVQGITYFKINRIDFNGNNISEILQGINTIYQLIPANTTYLEENILSIQEFGDYYLYTIKPNGASDYYATSTPFSARDFIFDPIGGGIFFENSEYNALINNADIARVDPEFFDVDFSSNAVTAVNTNVIISASRGSGSATPAAVQASNYTTARVTNPRYNGCKNTSTDFNVIDNTQLPSIEKTISYFIYTPGGYGNTLAERSGSGNYKIGFLVDELGNITQPKNDNTSSAYIPNLLDAFGADSTVILSPNNNITIDQSEYTVYKPGVVSNIIMYSDTGSLGTTYLVSGSYQSLNFHINPNEKYSYNFGALKSGGAQSVPTLTSATASFNYIIQDTAQGWTSSINAYHPPTTKGIRNSISASLAISTSGTGGVTMSIMNGNTPLTAVSSSGPGTFSLKSSTIQYFNTSDLYWIKIINNTNNSLSISQYSFPADITSLFIYSNTSSIQANSPYWYTSSNAPLVLSSSIDIGKAYQYYAQVPVTASGTPLTSSGFDNPQPLIILPYDEIRFEGNEATVATIVSSSFDISNLDAPVLYLHLQAPFAFDSVDIQYFAIRRWVPSIDNIIINSPGTVMGSGFIFPKYPSPLLKKNLPSIIENLTNKGLV